MEVCEAIRPDPELEALLTQFCKKSVESGRYSGHLIANGQSYRRAFDGYRIIPKAKADKIGPNDPCLCGSEKKYKKCCA